MFQLKVSLIVSTQREPTIVQNTFEVMHTKTNQDHRPTITMINRLITATTYNTNLSVTHIQPITSTWNWQRHQCYKI